MLIHLDRILADRLTALSSTNNENILEETDDKFTFPAGAVRAGDNVITIVQVGWIIDNAPTQFKPL